MNEQLPSLFPGLRRTPFRITSSADHKYNCIAWAANDMNHWWWPAGTTPDVVWPGSVRDVTLIAFTTAFSTIGYIASADESLEPGFEKVALFADADGTPTHASLQLPSGAWTSILGNAEDIEHKLRALEGDIYGTVALILKRPFPQG